MDSLPNRELRKSEVDALDESDAIDGTFPVYMESPGREDRAVGLIIVRNNQAHALAFKNPVWETIEKRDIEADEHGVRIDDQDTLSELQELVAEEVGAVGF